MKYTLLVIMSVLLAHTAPAQDNTGRWDELVGKTVIDSQGKKVGTVKDTVVDIEHGRFLGMVVSTGLFGPSKIVPLMALTEKSKPRTLYLNMTKEQFLNAPTFELSKKVGPPQTTRVLDVYKYYNQIPNFSTNDADTTNHLGYVLKGSQTFYMPVENLQGKEVGYVTGLRELNRLTGNIKGVVVKRFGGNSNYTMKLIQPQDLRFNMAHTRFRINNHEQEFRDSANFKMDRSGFYVEEAPQRPGEPRNISAQGDKQSDKDITLSIRRSITKDSSIGHYGKNISVTTKNGKVMLAGRVSRPEIKARILSYAYEAAGQENVTEVLEVRPQSEAEGNLDSH